MGLIKIVDGKSHQKIRKRKKRENGDFNVNENEQKKGRQTRYD